MSFNLLFLAYESKFIILFFCLNMSVEYWRHLIIGLLFSKHLPQIFFWILLWHRLFRFVLLWIKLLRLLFKLRLLELLLGTVLFVKGLLNLLHGIGLLKLPAYFERCFCRFQVSYSLLIMCTLNNFTGTVCYT